ncbi:MAG: hypothetical protein DME26_12155 [Verrucomicrobia bacterium]|nr:MAG: hypothetical protein DME26_12155 [Verrucomicrobiota bacterium]
MAFSSRADERYAAGLKLSHGQFTSSLRRAFPKRTAGMKRPLHVLIVEDSEFDAQLVVGLLKKSGYDVSYERIETAEALKSALATNQWEIILADYNLPNFSAPEALKILQESGRDLPFIIISGGIGEDIAVAAMKAGAHDYLMKGNLSRLPPAVDRELREAANRASQREAKRALLESELRYRLLWETSPDAVIFIDTGSNIHFANPAVKDVFGYPPGELVGKNLAVLQPERLRAYHRHSIAHYLSTGEKRLNWRATETVGVRKDGTEIPIEISFSDIELNGEKRFVGFIRDISERKRAQQELRENEEQFRIAREIQQRLFPKAAPEIPGFDLAGATYPAEATGGDYFDFLPMLHGRLGIIIGDVTGHGVGPALLMAETRAYLRILTRNRDEVGEILRRANRVLAEDVGAERYVTLFLSRLDPSTRAFVYASAGHPTAYVLSASGEIKASLKRTGVPLGIHADTHYQPAPETSLLPGELLLAVTDGLEEAMAPDETAFSSERVLEIVRSHRGQTARQIVEALYQGVREFSGNAPQMDDVTAVVVKVAEPPTAK